MHHGVAGEADVNVCSDAVPAGAVHCFARVVTSPASGVGAPKTGYDPFYLRSAYNVPSTGGSGRTVAVVVAYDNPKAESDLAAYRKKFKMPACTTANGCFTKLDQRGGTSYPVFDAGWALEGALDVDMVSAMCPNCHIVLVEADSNSSNDLYPAQDIAAAAGADVINNSWGGDEHLADPDSNHFFQHPGVVTVVATGDFGNERAYPATSPDVIAVGGTTLLQTTNKGTRTAAEAAWGLAGDGCSAFQTKPAWQTDAGCAGRTVGDVSAVADPETGVRVYDTNPGFAKKGWIVVGGTSAASPIVAGCTRSETTRPRIPVRISTRTRTP